MSSKKVHLVGIGGSAMSNLALMFSRSSWKVTGSDQNVYPPASTTLEAHQISYSQGYTNEYLRDDLDLVVIGNVVSRENTEAKACLEKNLPYTSMSGALFDFFMKEKKRIAVCGTHGKTTTTSLMAWVYHEAGVDPSYFVGGIPNNFDQGFRLGKGDHFVIEGDEYDTAYFEKTPKFLHYKPQHVIITSIEFDHADIYRDFDHVFEQFEKLVAQLPPDGSLIACSDHDAVAKVAKGYSQAITYGKQNANWTYQNQKDEKNGQSFDVFNNNQKIMHVHTHLLGEHNRLNILAVIAQADVHGLDLDRVRNAISTFQGVKKRQEWIGECSGVAVYEDFAHHPSAIATTIDGFLPMVRARQGRLIVALEPRSNTMRRKIFQQRLVESFAGADIVCVNQVFQKKDALEKDSQLSPDDLVADLTQRGIKALAPKNVEELIAYISQTVQSNDVVVFMSNGNFDDAARRLTQKLCD